MKDRQRGVSVTDRSAAHRFHENTALPLKDDGSLSESLPERNGIIHVEESPCANVVDPPTPVTLTIPRGDDTAQRRVPVNGRGGQLRCNL